MRQVQENKRGEADAKNATEVAEESPIERVTDKPTSGRSWKLNLGDM